MLSPNADVYAKAYFTANDNFLLIPNREFGNRKLIYLDINAPTSPDSNPPESSRMMRQLSTGKGRGACGKSWAHPPEALHNGSVMYTVKFLGNVEVDQAKGSEVVRDAIRKLKFNKQLRKSEGFKPLKVDLLISVDSISIVEQKYKTVQHHCPLHRISYCADDKSDKRMFSFIAKDKNSEQHQCFVFDSEKCAEEITLTVGQAFDLAYQKFLNSAGRDFESKKQYLLLQKKVQQLTEENKNLKERLREIEKLVEADKLKEYYKGHSSSAWDGINLSVKKSSALSNGSVKTTPTSPPILSPPPPVPARQNISTTSQSSASQRVTSSSSDTDIFGATPFNVALPTNPFAPSFASSSHGGDDPFGMGTFSPTVNPSYDIDQQISNMDRELLDLQIWENSWPWNYVGCNEPQK